MRKGSIIAINKSKGTLISCNEGNLWLTEPGSIDIHLKKGDNHKIITSGKIVLQAISQCSFEVQ